MRTHPETKRFDREMTRRNFLVFRQRKQDGMSAAHGLKSWAANDEQQRLSLCAIRQTSLHGAR